LTDVPLAGPTEPIQPDNSSSSPPRLQTVLCSWLN
jgi:hypothetical protein